MSQPTSSVHQAAAIGFDRAADAYERSRPSYPQEAIEFIRAELAIGVGSRVLDLAAGTGKLTRLLIPLGATLVAVEPVAGMRRILQAALPRLEVREGTAEAIPLADTSLDAVTCAQAFHWFDGPKALAEIRRVLRPGGGLAVIFNIRDESVPWVHALTELTGVETAPRPHHSTTRREFSRWVAADGGYAPAAVARFRYAHAMTADSLAERVASQSWIAAMPDAERDAMLERVRALARTHPDLAGRAAFEMPYDTEVLYTHTR
jgi:ubiquinone/menaquinone biosynthesis C-methylase UbiE